MRALVLRTCVRPFLAAFAEKNIRGRRLSLFACLPHYLFIFLTTYTLSFRNPSSTSFFAFRLWAA